MNNQQVETIKQVIADAVAQLFSLLLDDDESSKVNYDPNLILIRPLDNSPKIPKIEVIVFMKSIPSGDDIPVYQLILDGNILGNFRVSRIHSYTGNWRITDEAVSQMRRGTEKVDNVLSDIEHHVKEVVEVRKPPLYKQYGRPCTSTPPQINIRNSVSNVARQATKTAEENFASFNGGSFGHRQRHFHNMGNAVDLSRRPTFLRSPTTDDNITIDDVIKAARHRGQQTKPNISNRTYRTFYYSQSHAVKGLTPLTGGIFVSNDRSKPVVLLEQGLHHNQGIDTSDMKLTVSFISEHFKPGEKLREITDTDGGCNLLNYFYSCPELLTADIENLTGFSMDDSWGNATLRMTYFDKLASSNGLVVTDADMVCIEQRLDNDSLPNVIYLQRLNDGSLCIHTFLNNVSYDTRFPLVGILNLTSSEDIKWANDVTLSLENLIDLK